MTEAAGGGLHVAGVERECTIGVTQRERATKQRVVVSMKLNVSFGRVAASGAIQDSVDDVVSRS
jgi:dihydroneopterin aldolase